MATTFSGGKKHMQSLEATAVAQPWIEAPRILTEGIPLGNYVGYRGERFDFDFHRAAEDDKFHATNVGVVGMMGSGKSVLLKLMGSRYLLRRGRLLSDGTYARTRVRFNDYKREGEGHEYDALVERHGGVVIDLARTRCVNIFDPRMNLSEEQAIRGSLSFLENHGIVLIGHQPTILQVGIHRMYKEARDRASLDVLEGILDTLTMQDLREYHADMRSTETIEVLRELEEKARKSGAIQDAAVDQMWSTSTSISPEEFRSAKAQTSSHFKSILHGPYGSVYGNVTDLSLFDALGARVVSLIWRDVPEVLRTILHEMMWEWEEAEIAKGSHRLTPDLDLREEQGEAFRNLRNLTRMRDRIAKSREESQARVFCSQYSEDFLVGDEGSEHRLLARAVMRGFGGWFAGKMQDNPSNREMLAECGFSRVAIEKITSREFMGKHGRFAFKPVGSKERFIDIRVVDFELPLIQTNSARHAMLA